jgi:hypothetical protein
VGMSLNQRGKIAALSRWSREDPGPAMAKARQGRYEKLEDQVDPDRTLSESERAKRVGRLQRAHMLKLAALSAKARAKKAAT